MKTNWLNRSLMVALVAGLMGASYMAGTAQGATDTSNKLYQASDLLKKARAIIGAISTRQGYGNIEKAKADMDDAIIQVDTAAKLNGG